jgi:lactoylglutathione lyase
MNINLVVLKTTQPENLVAFYEQIGFKFSNHRHGNGPLHYAAELPGFAFEIYPFPDGIHVSDNTTRLGFTVADMEITLEQLKSTGMSIKKEPMITEWGYQALVEDPDGRKVEIKEENTNCSFVIEDTFKTTGRGLVVLGTLSKGAISSGDELIFVANGVVRKRRIAGVDAGVRGMSESSTKTGILLKCIDDKEIDELRNWNASGQLALIKKGQVV